MDNGQNEIETIGVLMKSNLFTCMNRATKITPRFLLLLYLSLVGFVCLLNYPVVAVQNNNAVSGNVVIQDNQVESLGSDAMSSIHTHELIDALIL